MVRKSRVDDPLDRAHHRRVTAALPAIDSTLVEHAVIRTPHHRTGPASPQVAPVVPIQHHREERPVVPIRDHRRHIAEE